MTIHNNRKLCGNSVARILIAIVVLALYAHGEAAQSFRYKDYRKEKAEANKLLGGAMQLNFKVTQMLINGSGNVQEMSNLLSRSYGLQQRVVTPIEGIPDPGLIYVIKLINEIGKPDTENAGGAIRSGNMDQALELLEKVRKAHQQMLVVLR